MMGKVTMSHHTAASQTAVTNAFIDYYMGDANDAQIKVYLYLLRMMQAGLSTSVCDIADKFNDTEKDIMRALTYWEKKGLISLEYDGAGHLLSISLEDIPEVHDSAKVTVMPGSRAIKASSPATPAIAHRPKKSDEKENQQLVFLAEQYFGRTLSPADIQKIFYIHNDLEFSMDLMDYLMQYCAEQGKKDFRYMEKVAENWAEAGIKTTRQAKARARKYNKNVYTVMKELGFDNTPAPAEAAYIERWFNEYGFSLEIVIEACSRTVLSTQKNRLQYAEGILKSWHESNVSSQEDITKLDQSHTVESSDNTKASKKTSGKNNLYLQFQQNTYDFDALEKELIKN
ncbi:DnaD and phage-associated domain-containing protein [Butyrivibrio fibrisolvens DSM 3071]|uniref:DnaD and phage-associated domain-containing protein n=1 Tax=Butyrivibrio fibrisolvens DSM 3071 TaxID=1121131 RepID=A0A1M5XXC0_BUTFI|nr:DnaD domain protein [Butyrivibrio fibrisolvens]SHI04386.1 DnaD and phage-associated domain-containing protein [Butyrivibrio fibrisolvens DSM 3071]